MKYYAEDNIDKYILENYFPISGNIMVEVGAGHPEIISMSKAFRERNWRTICIEPNPRYVELHKKEGNEIYQYAISEKNEENVDFVICTDPEEKSEGKQGLSTSSIYPTRQTYLKFPKREIIKVKVITLNSLLEKLNIEKVDFVSIDVEGWELEVMKGFNVDKYKPLIILLENFRVGDESGELGKRHKYMESRGYILDHEIIYNYLYKRKF